ncbi:DUF86 domain-containing protein [Desulfococcaceae bacterium HSG8]|nr:DUF86 domain-containing protein [Desulfococcaceae bacterium HSG8]
MTAKRDDSVYLQHILDAIAKIEKYLTDADEEKFMRESLIQDGVIRQLEIFGEAVKNLSSELREENEHIPWKDMAGMRDKLIHHYFGVDLRIVWMTATEDIPSFKAEIGKILENQR